jgi:aspartate aminotransferase
MLGDRFATSGEIADFLLKNARIVLTDGAGFGADGYLRFSYATSMENLERAVSEIKALFGSRVAVAV